MPPATTHPTAPVPVPTVSTVHLALDPGNTTWKLAFATGMTHAPRLRAPPARDLAQFGREITVAKARCGLPLDSCERSR